MSFVNYFKQHIEQLIYTLGHVSAQNSNKLLEMIQQNTGSLFFTGVGKNGHVAAKAASTFCSVGIPAHYINPVDAMHGDLGMIKCNDLIIAVSKSGNTEELVYFLQQVYLRTQKIVLLHSNPNCSSEKYASLSLHIPIQQECDHLNIVPTASIVIFTTYLQSIACELAHQNQLTKAQFVTNHPGGSLGKIDTQ